MIRLRPSPLGLLALTLTSLSCQKTPPSTLDLSAMTHGAGVFLAVGASIREENSRALVLRSPDGVSWNEVALAAPGSLVMLAPGGPGLVAVGSTRLPLDPAGAGGTSGAAGSGNLAGQATGGGAGAAGASAGAGGEAASGASGQAGAGEAGSGASGQAGAAGDPGSTPMNTGENFPQEARGLVMVSTDGLQWQTASNPPPEPLRDVAALDAAMVAISRQRLYRSSDGNVWLEQPVGAATDERWTQVEAGNGRFVVLGKRPAVSTDGRTWQPVTTIPEGELRGLRFSEDAFYAAGKVGGFFGGVGEDGCVLLRSVDGVQWAPVQGAVPGCAIDVASNGSQALVLTSRGVHEASSFRGPWSLRSTLEDETPLRLEYAGRWVLATRDGLWGSPDGRAWRRTYTP